MGRNTQGVRVIDLKDGDKLGGVELVSARTLTQYAATTRQRRVEPEPTDAPEPPDDEEPEEPPDEPEPDDAEPDDDESDERE
jgi:DNA gyrase subunit A